MRDYRFPAGFVWGVATAATQIEGGARADGKGESIWDRFVAERQPRDHPITACDHYHRFGDDIDLMTALGMTNYRFSISWPRIFPSGRGEPNPSGFDFYDRLIDRLLAAGIAPWATMYHWDLPQALEDEGGWRVRSTVDAFADYAAAIVGRFGDRVKNWWTMNELSSFIGLGYGTGSNAPGRRESAAVLNQAYHHALLAHGHGVQAVRAHGGPGARVGLVHNPETPIPLMEVADDIAAARQLYALKTAQILGPLYRGRYPESFLDAAGQDAPLVVDGDLALIAAPTDYLGLNIYTGSFVQAAPMQGTQSIAFPSDFPHGTLSWLKIAPQSLYWAARHATETYGVDALYITENGLCCEDRLVGGHIQDVGRRDYLRNYLIALHRAVDDGCPVRGYFLWSLLDNFEWAEGYDTRFGIVHVDYATQQRTPKLSAAWYAEVVKRNGLV